MLPLLACTGPAPVDSAAPAQLELVDAHIHLLPGQDPDELLDLADAGGFDGLFVLGPASSASLAEAHDEVHGFIFLENEDARLEITEELLASVRQRLERGAAGIGELSIVHFGGGEPGGDADNAADDEGLLALYDLAAEHGAPIVAHLDYTDEQHQAWSAALSHNPATTFVWAHAGDTGPAEVRALVEAHDNLLVDLSCRNPLEPFAHRPYSEEEQSIAELDRVTLRADWAELFEDHPDRFLFGSDIGPGDRNEAVEDIAAFYRLVLEQLEPETAAAIGHGNARALLE